MVSQTLLKLASEEMEVCAYNSPQLADHSSESFCMQE
jgi:hypothetical protein